MADQLSHCRVYLKSGQVIDLYGKGFKVTYGKLEHDTRSLGWEELDLDRGDPLYLDAGQAVAVIVTRVEDPYRDALEVARLSTDLNVAEVARNALAPTGGDDAGKESG